MSGAEPKSTTQVTVNWENELWAYVNSGNGKDCPGSDDCLLIRNGPQCFNSEAGKGKVREIRRFVDGDLINPDATTTLPHLSSCVTRDNITLLVRKVARLYRYLLWDGSLPVPDDLFTQAPDGMPIEVRYVSLKASQGAVWRMDDAWLIYLNSDAPKARQRFTLYHEIFHIMAHCNGDPVFEKSENGEICFNEFLADHFAGNILMPRELVLAKWPEIKDANKMAELFDVPAPIMYGNLRAKGLVPLNPPSFPID